MDELINKKITICYGPLSWFSELVEKGSLFSCWGNRVRLVVGRTLSSVSR